MVGPSAIILQKWEEVIQPIIGTLLHNRQMTCKSSHQKSSRHWFRKSLNLVISQDFSMVVSISQPLTYNQSPYWNSVPSSAQPWLKGSIRQLKCLEENWNSSHQDWHFKKGWRPGNNKKWTENNQEEIKGRNIVTMSTCLVHQHKY